MDNTELDIWCQVNDATYLTLVLVNIYNYNILTCCCSVSNKAHMSPLVAAAAIVDDHHVHVHHRHSPQCSR
jgi:hypothetical protein